MPGSGALRVGRLAGIPIGIHPLWLVIVVLLTAALGGGYYPDAAPSLSSDEAYLLGLASVLTLFAGILAHEIGHAVVARRHGVEIEEIDLWLLGGVARMANEPPNARAELRFAIAGPAVTLGVIAVAGAARVAGADAFPQWLVAFLDYQLYVNGAILVFNLLPAFPLDGGRVLRALLWRRSGDHDGATIRAGRVGAGFGWGFVAVGALTTLAGANGILLMLVGGFVVLAARAEQDRARVHHALGGTVVGDVMVRDPVTVTASMSAREVAATVVPTHLYTAFPAVDEQGRALGLLSLSQLRRLTPAERMARTVADVADVDPDLIVAPDLGVADLALRPAFVRTGRAVVTDRAGLVIGLVSATDIGRRLRARELLDDTPARPGQAA